MKEAFVLAELRQAGLPTPTILAATDGIEPGAPPAMLYSDPGGSPLQEHASASLTAPVRGALWSEVGHQLRQLHDVDVAKAGALADPENDRPWMKSVAYFAKALRGLKKKQPALEGLVDELVAILRGPVASHLGSRPCAICCGHYALPGLMLDASGGGWDTKNWLSLGYYVSVGDPDRDITAIATLYRRRLGTELPDSFYETYGRRPDPIGEVVYDTYLRMHTEPTAIGEAVGRLKELCR